MMSFLVADARFYRGVFAGLVLAAAFSGAGMVYAFIARTCTLYSLPVSRCTRDKARLFLRFPS